MMWVALVEQGSRDEGGSERISQSDMQTQRWNQSAGLVIKAYPQSVGKAAGSSLHEKDSLTHIA